MQIRNHIKNRRSARFPAHLPMLEMCRCAVKLVCIERKRERETLKTKYPPPKNAVRDWSNGNRLRYANGTVQPRSLMVLSLSFRFCRLPGHSHPLESASFFRKHKLK
ncbi:UNVERIFIED_CONTAM: hypothetical protein K2H54_013391 [Gekko kuhli]